MIIHDRAVMTARERTVEGYLKVRARLSRNGVQDYLRGELGLDGDPRAIIRIYRPDEEVFSDAALSSFALKPVTDDHPRDFVSADNARQLAVGWSGESITRDGNFTMGDLLITDGPSIRKVETGKVEISLGYSVDLHLEPGIAFDGVAYDAVQRNIRGNHIALVDAGRCGGECRILDRNLNDCGGECGCASCRQTKESVMTDKPKAKLVDGVPVSTLDEAFEVIERKNSLISEAKDAAVELRDKLLAERKSHNEEVSKLEDKIATLEAKLSDSEIEKRAEARIELMTKAADYLPDDYETNGKTSAQIAKDALVAAYGNQDIVAKKTDEALLAMFDGLCAAQNSGEQIGKMVTPRGRRATDNGYAGYRDRLSNDWQTAGVQKSA